jgi:hypothetical protein
MARHVHWALAACFALIFTLSLTGVRANGDCREYVLMARAFASHGTPDIRKEDVAWLVRTEPFLGRVVPAERLTDDRVPEVIPHLKLAPSGHFYSLHFWLYSLLAAPFIWLTDALGFRPLTALTTVNACAASAVVTYLVMFFRGTVSAVVAPLLFLGSGTLFYLHWPGPEVLTAASVLVATLSGLRGNIGIGMLAGGLAAVQNPSAGGVILLVGGHWLALRFGQLPAWVDGWCAVPVDARQLTCIGAAVAVLLLPYAFFLATFGRPSLIAELGTDLQLIGLERTWSLLFDLNQGMFSGMPGLFLALVLLGTLASLRRLRRAGAHLPPRAALVGGAFVVMIVPTLSIHNWNSGGVVFHRYCTWLSMPLVGAVMVLVPQLSVRAQRYLVGSFAVAQAAVVATNGLSAEPTLYMQHGTLARYVLQHWPSGYNPIPEIFIERTLGREIQVRPDQMVVWPRGGGPPKKVLVHESRPLTVAWGCLPGQIAVGATEPQLGAGWRYVNAPFRCTDP